MNDLPDLEVSVVSTGVANLASVFAALSRLGVRARLSEQPGEVLEGQAVILPGVGAFGSAMDRLRQADLTAALIERIRIGAPTLAICLGMQLLLTQSEESPGVRGLGVLPGVLRRFPSAVRTPQMGWNELAPDADCQLLRKGWAYFANSYRLTEAPAGWSVAWSDHGGRFVAAMERGAVLACQFHPELSGAWGLSLLGRWLVRSAAPAEVAC